MTVRMTFKQSAQLSLGLLISIFFVWLTLRSIPVSDVLTALGAVEPAWMLLALSFFGLGYACRIERWRRMLATHNPEIAWSRSAVPFMTSIAANNLLPFRAGDALRAIAFSGWLGVPVARVLATLLAERLMDLLSLLLGLSVALVLVKGSVGLEALLGWSAWLFGAAAVVVAAVLLFPRTVEPPVSLLLRALSGAAPGMARSARLQIDRVFGTLESLAERGRISAMMGWSLLAWGFEGCMFYAVARALPDLTAPVAAWLAMPVGTLSTMLPSAPGYIGTFHYFVMQVMEALGNDAVASTAFAFLVHFTLYAPVTLIGGACFAYWVLVRAHGTSKTTVFSNDSD